MPHSKSEIKARRKNGQLQIAELHTNGTSKADPDDQNDDRAKWAEEAILTFIEQTGTDARDAVCDLVADLMHWCDRHDLDFDIELERGQEHYREETTDTEPTLGEL